MLKRYGPRLIRIGFAIVISIMICQFPLDFLEGYFYDMRIQFKPASPVSDLIQTVVVDQETLRALQRDPHAPDHIIALKNLLAAGPRNIVMTFSPAEIVGSYDELKEWAKVATSEPGKLTYLLNQLPIKGSDVETKLPAPLETVAVMPGLTTYDKTIFAKDGVTRRFIYSYESNLTLHAQIANAINGLVPSQYYGLFDYIGTKQGYIDFHPIGTYKPISFMQILNNTFDHEQIKDKIVLIGRDTLEDSRDYIVSPYSRNNYDMTNLEMHANIFDTLILNRAPILPRETYDFILTLLIAIVTVWVVLALRPTRGLMILGGVLLAFALLSFALFATARVWIGMAHPLLAIFICYYFFIPYRLIRENRKSWEYYQRNKLLTEVEELKSNFLRMMSHDLKTPLARIQGMADIMGQEAENLNDKQREALQKINSSSEELVEFIGSVLSLNRIEGKEVKLHLKSKDVNKLVHDVVNRCADLAKKKSIQVILELEPLFSMKMDEDLIRQVLMNLLENAIKYSHENSKILITTEEHDGQAMIQVADQGVGIDQADLPNIFDKFYRARDVKDSEIKGSGLGLYLAKYFVQLHSGHIYAESEPGKGSTFTVQLPMDLEFAKALEQQGERYGESPRR